VRTSGLELDPLPSLAQFFQHSEELLRGYEREIGQLPPITPKLRADARGSE
jgi:hypothetical protein